MDQKPAQISTDAAAKACHRPKNFEKTRIGTRGTLNGLLFTAIVLACTGNFLVLDRKQANSPIPVTRQIVYARQNMGRYFDLPDVSEPIWAEINVRPTFPGRVVSTLFKSAQLHITLRFADGHIETFRYAAALGPSGFIVSPNHSHPN